MQGSRLQTLGLALEVDKQEIEQESPEQEQEDVQELYLGITDDGCQHHIEARSTMAEMMVGTCNGHRDLDDEEVHRRWDTTPGPHMSLLPAFLPLSATSCSPPGTYLARGATCWAAGDPPGSRGSGTSLILSVLCESNCVHAFSCICLLLFSLGVLQQAARCLVIQ